MLELQLAKNLFKHGICSSLEVTNNDSISQHKAIQSSNLKQFNCLIEKKNIHLHIVETLNMICKKLNIYID